MSKILAIRRDDRFSPNSVEADRAILQAVINRLPIGEISILDEQALTAQHTADIFLSMARLPRTLAILKDKQQQGAMVVNSAYSVEACSRSRLHTIMKQQNIAMPPEKGRCGYWVKRGDAAAQSQYDVVYCKNEAEVKSCVEAFGKRGINDIVVSAHIQGDLIKFYGVGNSFFKYFYPTEKGHSKFGNEQINGKPHHYAFNAEILRKEIKKLANAINIDVYGGDCIVDAAGRFYIIDFNDWPSFSVCRDEAANAIAKLVEEKEKRFFSTAGSQRTEKKVFWHR